MANAATLKSAKPQIATASTADAPTFVHAMLSHRGRVRHANEDACAALPGHRAFIVCDGMGGAAAGEVASHLATDAFLNSLSQSIPCRPRLRRTASSNHGIAEQDPANHPRARLHEAIRAANRAVFHRAQKSRALHGMGTTLVAVLLENTAVPLGDAGFPRANATRHRSTTLWLAHVGDSRCYRFRASTLELLTQDHSLVEEQVRAGLISAVDAADSPIRNIITRAIGSQSTVEPDIAAHATQPGDLYLLASDGLTRELDDTEIAHILAHSTSRTLESVCQALIDAANKKGGHDNITVLLVSCP